MGFRNHRPQGVSIHPRLFRRGNGTTLQALQHLPMFQSTPAFSGEGTHQSRWENHLRVRFNPPPPIKAREQTQHGRRHVQIQFQSTPAFSGEGTSGDRSIRISPEFQSTPAFSGEGTSQAADHVSEFQFQSTPAFSGEGTQKNPFRHARFLCFNPPPPFQAREHPRLRTLSSIRRFNPPPPFQARELGASG